MYNQRTSRGQSRQKPRFGTAKSGGRFRGGPSRFGARKGKTKTPKLDISSFINRATAMSAPLEVFVPEHSFVDFRLSSPLLRSIEQKGYLKPTPIQDKIIPSILEGKDVVGLSNTGTGKTAAFLVPLIGVANS
jgi:hypothetical protein